MSGDNRHAVGVIVEVNGLLILGAPGAGKSSLALELLARCAAQGRFARLVADDQLFLEARGGRLVARAPETIFGLAEARGWRPSPLRASRSMLVDLAISLVGQESAPRHADDVSETIRGVAVPALRLRAGDPGAALRAISARLGLPPFGR